MINAVDYADIKRQAETEKYSRLRVEKELDFALVKRAKKMDAKNRSAIVVEVDYELSKELASQIAKDYAKNGKWYKVACVVLEPRTSVSDGKTRFVFFRDKTALTRWKKSAGWYNYKIPVNQYTIIGRWTKI